MANIKLMCCESPITLEELPANYGHQFIGRCEKCGNSYGIEDLTDNECSSDNCDGCDLTAEEKSDNNCKYCD